MPKGSNTAARLTARIAPDRPDVLNGPPRVNPSCCRRSSALKICVPKPVLTGKYFRLDRATIASDGADGERRVVVVPTGSVIKIVDETANHGGSSGNGMLDVLWDGRIVEMFAIDVEARGKEIQSHDDAPA